MSRSSRRSGRLKTDVSNSEQFCYDFASLSPARYYGKIQDHDEAYYKSFNLIITGLDSVEARRWINATLVGMVDDEDPESLKPLIDGGTEGEFVVLLVAKSGQLIVEREIRKVSRDRRG